MNKQRGETLEDIYREHAKSLYYYLLKLSGSPTVAEDLVQDTFVKATISIHKVSDITVKAWLYQVARNAYLDQWRRSKRWKWVPFQLGKEMHSPYGVPEEELEVHIQKQEVTEWLSLLPENYRTALWLREKEELSYEEIAKVLQVSSNQVKITIHRARKRLRELNERKEGTLSDDGMDEG